MTIRRNGDWMTAAVNEELVMMSVEKGTYVGLNAVGRRVWELLETPQQRTALYATLEEEFDVAPEVCRAYVDRFLAELEKQGAIVDLRS
jgi:hypothetical protein